jgi:hypothetical protein
LVAEGRHIGTKERQVVVVPNGPMRQSLCENWVKPTKSREICQDLATRSNWKSHA